MNVQEWTMWECLTALAVSGLGMLLLYLSALLVYFKVLDFRERRLQVLSAKWRPK